MKINVNFFFPNSFEQKKIPYKFHKKKKKNDNHFEMELLHFSIFHEKKK